MNAHQRRTKLRKEKPFVIGVTRAKIVRHNKNVYHCFDIGAVVTLVATSPKAAGCMKWTDNRSARFFQYVKPCDLELLK